MTREEVIKIAQLIDERIDRFFADKELSEEALYSKKLMYELLKEYTGDMPVKATTMRKILLYLLELYAIECITEEEIDDVVAGNIVCQKEEWRTLIDNIVSNE